MPLSVRRPDADLEQSSYGSLEASIVRSVRAVIVATVRSLALSTGQARLRLSRNTPTGSINVESNAARAVSTSVSLRARVLNP